MNKKVFVTILLALCAFTCYAQEADIPAPRFGYLSYDEALKSMPAYAEAQKKLEELKASYDKELQYSESEFSKQYGEYIDGMKSFPENILLKRQKALQQLMEQSISFKDEAKRLLSKAEDELMQPVHERLKAAIAAVAKQHGYEFVLNTDNNAAPYVNGEVGADITAEVKEAVK